MTQFPTVTVHFGVVFFGRRGTEPTAAFRHRLTERRELSDTAFLIGSYGRPTAISRLCSNSQFSYVGRDYIGKWFHTYEVRVDRSYNVRVRTRASDGCCIG